MRSGFFTHPDAGPLPPAHDPGHRLDPGRGGRAEPHLVHRFVHVVGRKTLQHFRGGEPAGRLVGTQ